MRAAALAGRPVLLAFVLALVPAACVIDLGGGDDEPVPCKEVPEGAAGAPIATFLLNPETLQCEEAGGFPCGACGACDDGAADLPSWGLCQSQCTGLGINECGATSGCRQAWDEVCLLTDGPCFLPDGGYLGCFAVDMTGPVQGACEGLLAQECSRHDDCLATYRRDERCVDGQDSDFDGVIDEPDECLTFGLCLAELRRE